MHRGSWASEKAAQCELVRAGPDPLQDLGMQHGEASGSKARHVHDGRPLASQHEVCAFNGMFSEPWDSHILTSAHLQPGTLSVLLGEPRHHGLSWPRLSLSQQDETNCLSLPLCTLSSFLPGC